MKRAQQPGQRERAPAAWRRWALAVVVLAAIGGVALRFGQIQQFAELIRRAQPHWLLAAAALQCLTYLFVAAGWGIVLRSAGSKMRIGKLFQLALAKMFTDQAVPAAGMGGNLLIVDRLIAAGVPRGHAAAALIASAIGYYSGLTVLVLIALVLLWLHGSATPLLIGAFAVFLLIAVAIPAGWVWLSRRGGRPLPRPLARIRSLRTLLDTIAEAPPDLIGDVGVIARLAVLNALVFVADAATLVVCLLAIGQPPSIIAAYVALIVAQMVVVIGPVPMGLGTFEGSCIATLRLFGVPFEAALTATLLLRGFTLWLPLIPGLVVVRRLARPQREHSSGPVSATVKR